MPDIYSYDYEWDEKYCYPNSFVLKNKLNILDANALNNAEREITAMKILFLKNNIVKGNFDLKHLQKIHFAIFSDIYDWAGQLRTVDIAKGNMFCRSVYLESYAEDIFRQLKNDNYLLYFEKAEVPHKLAYYLGEINVLHPFREGNGRTQRLFSEYLAGINGFNIDFSSVTEHDMIEASAMAFGGNYSKMNKIFDEITAPISVREQYNNVVAFFGTDSEQTRLFDSYDLDIEYESPDESQGMIMQ
jgi:cell filamentation protein